jgi:hypothetical protein
MLRIYPVLLELVRFVRPPAETTALPFVLASRERSFDGRDLAVGGGHLLAKRIGFARDVFEICFSRGRNEMARSFENLG